LKSRVGEVDAPVGPTPDVLGLFPVVVLAVMRIPLGFTGDQALFATAAVELHQGRTLYRDFWDIKQPGIYWFFGLARFFGRGPVPVHILEVVVILIGAVMLQRTTRRWFADPRVSSFVPVLVYGPYLAVSGPLGTTQIEALMCTPLAVCLVTAFNPRKPRFFVAGLAGGVVLVLKVLFAPLVAVIAIGALSCRPSHERTVAVAGRRALVFTLGAAIPPILAIAWLLADHAGLGLLWRTTVVYPRQLAGLHGTNLVKPLASRFVGTYSLTGPLALVAVISWRSARRDLALTLLVMAGVALLIVVPQRWSTYQVYIEMLPIGLLAAFGVDAIVAYHAATGPKRSTVLAAAACLALLAVAIPAERFAVSAKRLVTNRLALTTSGREQLRRGADPTYAQISAEVDAARSVVGRVSTVYVLGNPLYYDRLGATQAIPINGWATEQISPRIWSELIRELEVTRPRLILVEGAGSQPAVPARAPALLTFIAAHYHPIRTSPASDPSGVTWYQSDDLRPGPPTTSRL